MDKVWTAAAILIYLVMLPCVVGLSYGRNDRKEEGIFRFLSAWVFGMMIMMAAYQLVAVPLILLHRKLTDSIILWHVLLAVWCVCSMIAKRKQSAKEAVSFRTPQNGWTVQEKALLAAVLLLVIIQGAVYVFGMHVDDDDARYVANALVAAETNTMYRYHPNTGEIMDYFMGEIGKEVTSPLMMYYASLSLLAGLHATIFMHTVLPPVLLVFSYGIVWLLSKEFWPEDRSRRLTFLLICSVFVIMGNTSIFRGETFTLMRIWQGKALVPAVFVPWLLMVFMKLYKGRETGRVWMELVAGNLAACLSSGMGILLSAVMCGICAIAVALRDVKLWKKEWQEREFFRKELLVPLKILLCCLPNAAYTGIYMLVHKVIIR